MGKSIKYCPSQTITSFILFLALIFFILTTFFYKIRHKIFNNSCESNGKIDNGLSSFRIGTERSVRDIKNNYKSLNNNI